MTKKIVRQNKHKFFFLHVFFKPHAFRICLYSNVGLVAWKTSRSEGYTRRTRVTRLVVSEIARDMSYYLNHLKVKVLESVIFKGQLRKSFSKAVLFSFIKNSSVKIKKIVTNSCIRFGGCKLSKKSRK